jgi:hypothetical protein
MRPGRRLTASSNKSPSNSVVTGKSDQLLDVAITCRPKARRNMEDPKAPHSHEDVGASRLAPFDFHALAIYASTRPKIGRSRLVERRWCPSKLRQEAPITAAGGTLSDGTKDVAPKQQRAA